MLIIGSYAAKLQNKLNLFDRIAPGDIDIICSKEDFYKLCEKYAEFIDLCEPLNQKKFHLTMKRGNPWRVKHFEIEIAHDDSSAKDILELVKLHPNELLFRGTDRFLGCHVANLNLQYAFKLSHRYLKNNRFFNKTRKDIIALRKELGTKEILDVLKPWFKKREDETYWYKHPKLNTDKKDFFKDDNIDYRWDHDSIHLAVALQDKPAYTYFKDDEKEVWCSKELFFNSEESIRINAVVEESLVLAVERSQVPFDFKTLPEKSFLMALEKVCTSITSGWFREYSWENYDKAIEVFHQTSSNYVDKFKSGIETGIVVPHNKDAKSIY